MARLLFRSIPGTHQLPKGSYTISVQAYNRQGANADIASSYNAADPKKDVLSYLFGNDAKEKLHHLYEYHYASKEELANNAVQISGTGTELDGQWVPDGVAGGEAAFAFNDRTDYTTTITCYVGEDGNSVSVSPCPPDRIPTTGRCSTISTSNTSARPT